jgi:hypothetical protein
MISSGVVWPADDFAIYTRPLDVFVVWALTAHGHDLQTTDA